MTRTGNVPTFGTLLRDLSADPAAVDEVARAARVNSPEVARLPADEVRRQVVLLLTSGLGALERHEDPAGRDFAEARRLGADRAAQGVTVAGLLRGVQAGRDRAVELVVRHGRAAGIPDEVLLEGLLTIGRYAAAVERAVVDGHRAAERDLLRTGAAARAHLLRRLLRDGPEGLPPAELTRFGLRPDGRYHCLVAAPPDPVRAHALQRQLIRHGGLLGTVDERLAGLLPRPRISRYRPDSADAGDARAAAGADFRPCTRSAWRRWPRRRTGGCAACVRSPTWPGRPRWPPSRSWPSCCAARCSARSTRPTTSTGTSPAPRSPGCTTVSGWTRPPPRCTYTRTRCATGCGGCGS
ncbi:hypothetical protein MCBG_02319 [Micromonospora sp. M42]|uniref:hypothetical protein n=1 Tax=Micromonospora sp. M42 TaxID=457406 RepID=UPI0003EEC7C9|nr:hypothetical protein [Micromonospora sp. M42]EWM65186.1 hypothetical protein MCBG_02319 [Micromonospora sp. M42]